MDFGSAAFAMGQQQIRVTAAETPILLSVFLFTSLCCDITINLSVHSSQQQLAVSTVWHD